MTPRHRDRRGSRRVRADRVRLEAARLLASSAERAVHVEDQVAAHERTPGPEGSADWNQAERRRLRELVFGCVRLAARYDRLVDRHRHKSRPMDSRVRATLHVALHEICETRAPDFASVSEAVEVARALGLGWADRFVNGLLRSVLREGVEAAFPAAADDPVAHACTWLSHPRWMVERWAERLGPEAMLALCRAQNRRPRLVLRTRPGERDTVLGTMRELGWEAHGVDPFPQAIEMESPVPPALLLQQIDAPLAVQDAAAQLVAPLLLEARPRRLVDLCAAPGGKATQLALDGRVEALVVALDASHRRVRRIVQSRRRLALDGRLEIAVGDGLRPPLPAGWADAVLVDAPCTGTGVLARRHEARWRRAPEDLLRMAERQRDLLHRAIDLVSPGGTIVYATCSLEGEENDEVVDRVLAQRDDVREIGVGASIPASMRAGERLQTWPHLHGVDGAFAARLQKTGGSGKADPRERKEP